jgi:hypothetical protein
MPDDRAQSTKQDASDTTVAVAGVLFIGPMASGRSGIWVGPAAGWRAPRGIHHWEREVSFVPRASMTPALAATLRATLPAEQIAPKRFPMAAKALEASPLLALSSHLVQPAQEQGVRVHTIGVDRVSGDFYYFEEGGDREPVRAQGSLVDMLSPSLQPGTTNAEIAVMMDGMLDRLLLALSVGEVSELDVELADALPRLSRDGTGLTGTDIEAFEAEASALAARVARWVTAAREIPEALAAASRRSKTTAAVPLFGEAIKETKPALDLLLGGKPLQLSPQPIWTVTGAPRIEEKPVAKPAPAPLAPVEAKVEPKPQPKVEPKAQPKAQPKAERKVEPKAERKTSETKRTPSPAPVRVAAKADPIAPIAPMRARMPSNVDTIPPPNPVARVSDRPPASPRAGTKPTPLKTPVPPRPAIEAPLVSTPASAPGLASETAPTPAPALASEPAPALASDPETAPESAPPSLPIVPSVASSVSRVPAKKPSTTMIVVVFALLAIAYVAFRSFQ